MSFYESYCAALGCPSRPSARPRGPVVSVPNDLGVFEFAQVLNRVVALAREGKTPKKEDLKAYHVHGRISPTPALARALVELAEDSA